MRQLTIVKVFKKQKYKLLLLVAYVPMSCFLIWVLAYYMRCPSPIIGSFPFIDVIRFYANPLNSNFGSMHWPVLVLSLGYLLLMIISTNTSKPVITIFQIRIVLLILIAVITIIVMIFIVLVPLHLKPQFPLLLFLFVDVDLILVYLLTFLPLFRPLKRKLINWEWKLCQLFLPPLRIERRF